jgi:uncharacterized ion transporter superfamily protein YfcC
VCSGPGTLHSLLISRYCGRVQPHSTASAASEEEEKERKKERKERKKRKKRKELHLC